MIVDLLKYLYLKGYNTVDKLEQFGFVSPYQGQNHRMKDLVSQYDQNTAENVLTIDSWQGREKEILFFSAVRSNAKGHVGFLDNKRRMNVALTRAQHGLVIVGNAKTLSGNKDWAKLVAYFRSEKCFAENMEEAKSMINQKLLEKKQMEDSEEF